MEVHRRAKLGAVRRIGPWLERLLWGALVLIVGYALLRGLSGENRWLDARPVYLGGYCWAHGLSPYVSATYSAAWADVYDVARPDVMVFAYPPSIAVLLVPLGLLPVQVALWAMDGLNVMLLGVCFASLHRLLRPYATRERDPRVPLALLAAASVGAVSATMVLGQTGFWVLAAILVLWNLPLGRPQWSATLLLALCSFKPTVGLPFLMYFLVLRPVDLVRAGVITLPVVLGVAWISGGMSVLGEWLAAMSEYSAVGPNLPSALASGHRVIDALAPWFPRALLLLVPAGAGLSLGLRERTSQRDTPSLESLLVLCAFVVGFAPIHDYDLVVALPLAAALPFVPRTWLWWSLPAVAILARPNIPAKILAGVSDTLAPAGPMLPGVVGIALSITLPYLVFVGGHRLRISDSRS